MAKPVVPKALIEAWLAESGGLAVPIGMAHHRALFLEQERAELYCSARSASLSPLVKAAHLLQAVEEIERLRVEVAKLRVSIANFRDAEQEQARTDRG